MGVPDERAVPVTRQGVDVSQGRHSLNLGNFVELGSARSRAQDVREERGEIWSQGARDRGQFPEEHLGLPCGRVVKWDGEQGYQGKE